MLSNYENVLEDIVRADPKVKPRVFRGKMLISFGIKDGQEPSSFPTSAQVSRKVGTVKKKLKKE